MKKLALFLCALLMTISIDAQDKRLKGVEKELNKILEATKAAGFAVAVVDGDKIVYAKGFGYSDYENKIPVDANTLFAIGSSTKAFTSAILGLLRADDKLSFDDNPRKHIPELEFFDDNMNNNMIIKDLMRHSTGLPRHDGSWYYFPTHSKDSLLMRIKHHEPFTGIRQQWYYNNFGFLAQGVIAERITGKSWEDNLKDYFFVPLEMTRTNATIAEMKSSSNAAFGYEVKDDKIEKMDYYDIAGMSPAGSINSSVNDMSKWLITWINDGKYKDKDIIPESYINEAMSSQMVVGGNTPDDKFPDIHFSNYGYGWFLQSYKGHYRVDHGGNIDGFSANVAFFPSDNIGIVVLANQNGSPVPSLVRNTIADRMIGEDRSDWVGRYEENLEKGKKAQKEAEENSETSNVKNTKPSHISLDYTGKYTHDGYGTFEIVSQNDSLFSTINSDKIYLHHYHYDVFEMIDVVEGKVDTASYGKSIKITFATNDAGDISGAKLKIEPTLDALEFKRTPNSIDVDTKTLEQYTGEYDISGTTIKVFIKKEALHLFIKGQPEYELIATAEHKFSFKTLEGFKVEFIASDDGTITELKAIQPNGTFVAKRK
ncbi:serine hydrolase [Psychroserpens algicola]|uniref:Serine hydrolase n=1 Tax=Psychroserpens algicola TaxID=1719034 RepID=A0ABT0H6S1_9FLAO|nr:serine hydrolase [Psychroserpens algicola]MCK8479527.1 serine hydrolase [Psychroserpens algicola]